jgi:hypothetical protein
LFIALLFAAAPKYAKAQKFSDNEIKTAFIFNFMKFTKWPNTPAQLKIGIIGKNDLAQTIVANLSNKKIGETSLDFLFVTDSMQIDNYDAIIYIEKTNGITSKTVKSLTKGKPILTIGTTQEFVAKDGIISIAISENNKKQILVNINNLNNSKITISSKLLALAEIIK